MVTNFKWKQIFRYLVITVFMFIIYIFSISDNIGFTIFLCTMLLIIYDTNEKLMVIEREINKFEREIEYTEKFKKQKIKIKKIKKQIRYIKKLTKQRDKK